jgi:glycosyltransferase involved in cell wall biosynthesis
MNPEITIGLTFYNNADTLRDALRSIFAQTFQNWELIIIDDHSMDGSFEIVSAVRDPRIRVYQEEKRLGFVNALNRMTELANGRYYARMDADDMMHPERLSRQLEFLKKHPDVDVVDTAMYSIEKEGKPVGIREVDFLDSRQVVLLRGNFFHHATIMGCTEWFQKNHYDPLFVRAEDCELWCRTFNTSHFARLNEPLYFVREGLVNVRNYLDSGQTVRRIIRTYGPKLTGRYRIMQLLTESYLKGFAYQALGMLNSHDLLVNMRNRRLKRQERERAVSIIDHVMSTDVPGL